MANFNTYRSCLIPYENEIVALRRKKPPMPFSQIAELLREKYQITVNRQAIFKFKKFGRKGISPANTHGILKRQAPRANQPQMRRLYRSRRFFNHQNRRFQWLRVSLRIHPHRLTRRK